ncbi:MAG: ABC transporter ATP-binding protein [Acidaminococcaceae bacterium]|nr:ABC transporter ATP-binding protein [Acidaminococcaceae bacterium]
MIEVKNLRKTFPHKDTQNKKAEKVAVENLSLTIGTGEIFGLLGPNGAGKTTTIRMLTMLSRPTSGEIIYDGKRISDLDDVRAIKQMIGVVPQNLNFDQDLTVGENLELHARLYHMDAAERRARISELLEYVELQGVINDGVRQLSGGMKRRLLIARALIHRPEILFLDEPTVALDPQVRWRIWELVRKLANDGATVLITTHYIEEAEELCDRVAIINKGRLIDVDTPQNFISRLGRYVVEWREDVHREFRFFDSREEARTFIGSLETTASIRKSNLEDVFIELTGRKEGL